MENVDNYFLKKYKNRFGAGIYELCKGLYEVEGQVDGKPYCMFVGAGNDGAGALAAIRRICNGYNFKEVQPPILVVGDLDDNALLRCNELGMAMGAGLEAGVF